MISNLQSWVIKDRKGCLVDSQLVSKIIFRSGNIRIFQLLSTCPSQGCGGARSTKAPGPPDSPPRIHNWTRTNCGAKHNEQHRVLQSFNVVLSVRNCSVNTEKWFTILRLAPWEIKNFSWGAAATLKLERRIGWWRLSELSHRVSTHQLVLANTTWPCVCTSTDESTRRKRAAIEEKMDRDGTWLDMKGHHLRTADLHWLVFSCYDLWSKG